MDIQKFGIMVRKLVWELLIERNQDKAVLLLNLLLQLGIHIVILPYEGVCVLGRRVGGGVVLFNPNQHVTMLLN